MFFMDAHHPSGQHNCSGVIVKQVVGIAVCPLLTWLNGLDHRVPGLVEMACGVLILR
jgi:hypothetical protein